MKPEGYVTITGVPGSRVELLKPEENDFTDALAQALWHNKMLLVLPDSTLYWAFVEGKQLYAFADGFAAIIGVGLYSHNGAAKIITLYDVDALKEILSLTSRGSGEEAEEVGDDYAQTVMDSLMNQGSPETNDSIGLRFKK